MSEDTSIESNPETSSTPSAEPRKAKAVRRGRARPVEKAEQEQKTLEFSPDQDSEQRHEKSSQENQHQPQRSVPKQHHNQQRRQQKGGRQQQQHGGKQQQQKKQQKKGKDNQNRPAKDKTVNPLGGLQYGNLPDFEIFRNKEAMDALIDEVSSKKGKPINFNNFYHLNLQDLAKQIEELGVDHDKVPHRYTMLKKLLDWAKENKKSVVATGTLDILNNEHGIITYEFDNYAIQKMSVFVHRQIIRDVGLLRGHIVEAQIHPPREGETCPFVIKVNKVMDEDPESISKRVPFEDLIPYYPTRRIFLETRPDVEWDNLSMRVVDILSPIGFGQRGLIVAPPRTGKTVLLQGIVHALTENCPDAHLMVLLIDERPEEVTDFKRQVTRGEVISSTFDQAAESHVHAAEMVIEKARRMVECGKDVIILLDSITRLARAYNTMMPSSGKILSGGVEANALQKPKRFFGSARNIEGGGSLTILGTALIETGSRMDNVIFEEFKGTGNMELNLDRELSNKRIFPAIAMDRSGTRKEELLYHPDELEKIYGLRRAMKGVPPVEAVEMLIQRIKKTKTNTEFLLALNR